MCQTIRPAADAAYILEEVRGTPAIIFQKIARSRKKSCIWDFRYGMIILVGGLEVIRAVDEQIFLAHIAEGSRRLAALNHLTGAIERYAAFTAMGPCNTGR